MSMDWIYFDIVFLSSLYSSASFLIDFPLSNSSFNFNIILCLSICAGVYLIRLSLDRLHQYLLFSFLKEFALALFFLFLLLLYLIDSLLNGIYQIYVYSVQIQICRDNPYLLRLYRDFHIYLVLFVLL